MFVAGIALDGNAVEVLKDSLRPWLEMRLIGFIVL